MKMLLSAAIFSLLIVSASGQDISGKWYGKLTQGPGGYSELYNIELDLRQKSRIAGESYSYMGDSLDVKIGLSGSIKDDRVVLQEDQQYILKEMVPEPWIVCIKKFILTYREENGHEYLQGQWSGRGKITEEKTGCPIEKDNKNIFITPGTFYTPDTINLTIRPRENDCNSAFNTIYEGGGPCIPGEVILARSKEDLDFFLANGGFNSAADSIPAELPLPVLTSEFNSTAVSKTAEIEVVHPRLRLRLHDYLKSDNDTVSVYLNRNPLARNIRISKQELEFDIKLDTRVDVNEILLFAENLGKVPPNTSMLEIEDGQHTYRVRIESDKQKTAAIYLRYNPSKPNSE